MFRDSFNKGLLQRCFICKYETLQRNNVKGTGLITLNYLLGSLPYSACVLFHNHRLFVCLS